MEELSKEEILIKEATEKATVRAKELTEKLGSEVTPFAFYAGEEVIIGYMKEPGRLAKMQAIDMYEQSKTTAGDIILRSGLIQEESDKRILEESAANDKIYLGAINFATKYVVWYGEILKKK